MQHVHAYGMGTRPLPAGTAIEAMIRKTILGEKTGGLLKPDAILEATLRSELPIPVQRKQDRPAWSVIWIRKDG